MRHDEWARLYPHDGATAWYADAARRAITDDAARWAHLFGGRLYGYLQCAPTSRSADETTRDLLAYTRWNSLHFVDTVRAIQAVEGGAHGVRAMHFHTLANGVLWMWRPVWNGGAPPNVRERRQSQLVLAIHASRMMMQRETNLAGLPAGPPPEDDPVLALQHGMLTETDTLVVVLEIIRRRPHLIAIPAPPRFESTDARHNVDLLVIDTRARTVVGLQVKTSITQHEKVRHLSRDILLVDGTVDLGNTRLVPRHALTATKMPTAWPGLISAHTVLRANPRSAVFAPHREAIEQLQAALPATVYGTTDYLDRAVRHLEDRILNALAS